VDMQPGKPRLWRADGHSVVGAWHIRNGVPNQDAVAWSPRMCGASSAVLTVADGHGASAHFRSALGAHMGVEAALRVLAPAIAAAHPPPQDAVDSQALVNAIIADWRTQVTAHLADHPLAGEVRARRGYDVFVPYGTTLIAAATGPAGALVLQVGDGDLLLGTADGELIRPLPPDVGLLGEQTFSLCQPDAASYTRARWFGSDRWAVDFIMLSTDGLAKSFADEDAFRAAAAHWRERIAQEGLDTAMGGIGPWLSQTSHGGSGDDITLGFLVADGLKPRTGVRGLDAVEALPRPRPRLPDSSRPTPRWTRVGRRVVTALVSALAAAAIATAAYVFAEF
jgi:hypothetical protein